MPVPYHESEGLSDYPVSPQKMNNQIGFAGKDNRVTSMPMRTQEGMFTLPGTSPQGYMMPVQSSPMLSYSGPPSGPPSGGRSSVQVGSGSTSTTLVGGPTIVNGVPMQAVGTYMPKGFVPVSHPPPNVQNSPTSVHYQPIVSPPSGSLYNSTGGLYGNTNAGSRNSVPLYNSNPGAAYGSQIGSDSATKPSPQQSMTVNQQVVGSYFLVPQQQFIQQQSPVPEGTFDHADHHHANLQKAVNLHPFVSSQMGQQTTPQQEASMDQSHAEAQRPLPSPMQSQQPVMLQPIAPQQPMQQPQPMVLQQRPISGLQQTPPPPQQKSEQLHPREHEHKTYMAMHMVPIVQPQVSIQYQQQTQAQVSTPPTLGKQQQQQQQQQPQQPQHQRQHQQQPYVPAADITVYQEPHRASPAQIQRAAPHPEQAQYFQQNVYPHQLQSSPPPPPPPQQQQQQQQQQVFGSGSRTSLGGDASSSPIERKAPPMAQRSQPLQLQRSATWSPSGFDAPRTQTSPPGAGQGDAYKREIGLGMLLERNSHEPHITRVREVVRNLGADKTQQIFTEDIVLEIDGRNIEMMDFEAAKRLCRGVEGSVARLTIDRAGRRFQVDVTRILPPAY